MGVKTFFQRLFGIDPLDRGGQESQAKFLNGSSTESSRYEGEIYANHLTRSIVHKIATYCSMISFEHCRGYGDSFEKMNSQINRLLTVKPNKWMTPSELLYKHYTGLLLKNNAYIWIKRDSSGKVESLIPIVASKTEMMEYNGELFYQFTFQKGDKVRIWFGDVLHDRQFYFSNDWFGDSNDPLRDPLGLIDTLQTSLDASLKHGAQLKGILRHQNTITPEDLAEHERIFRESYLAANNNGGVGMIDAKFDFIPLAYSGKITDAEQMKEIRDYVYRYFGVNDKIMLSSYSSDDWQAFHEGKITPMLNGTEQKLRIHLFSDTEIGYGNRIVSSVNNISFMNATQKIALTKLALDGALYNRNEIRQWFGDAPIPGGDTYQYSKNFQETSTKGDNDGEADQTDTPDAVPNGEETNT